MRRRNFGVAACLFLASTVIVALLVARAVFERPDDRILAQVGEWALSVADFEAEIARLGGRDSHRFASLEQRRALLDSLVTRQVLAAGARRAEFDQHPEVVASFERFLIAQFTEDEMGRRLAGLDVSEAEIESDYAARIEHFTAPERVRAAWLQVTVPARASVEKRKALRERARTARREAAALPSDAAFGAVAVRFSDDQATRYIGGDTGWLTRDDRDGRLGPEVVDAIFTLGAPGALSGVIDTPEGFAVVKLLDRHASTVQPLASVRDGIRARLFTRKRDAAHDTFLAEMRRRAGVTLNADALAAVQPPATLSTATHAPRPPALPGARGDS